MSVPMQLDDVHRRAALKTCIQTAAARYDLGAQLNQDGVGAT